MAKFKVNFSDASSEMRMKFDKHYETVTRDYEKLDNLPSINSVTLIGDKTSEDIHVQSPMREMTVQEIERILYLGGQ